MLTFTEANVLWFILAVVGACMSTFLVVEAVKDTRALKRLGRNGASGVLARATLIIESNKMLVHLMYIAIGIMSFLGPMPANRVTLAAGILIASSAIMDINSAVLIWANHKARKEIRKSRRNADADVVRDTARDAGRDPTRDTHRDAARDLEHDRSRT